MEIYKRMILVMQDLTHIGKDQKNAQQGFKYRGIDDIYNSLHNLMAKHEVFTTPEVLEKTREERTTKSGGVLAFTSLRMKYTFFTTDGSSVSCVVEGEGMDSGDKSSNKAMAVAHKYALLQTFLIPTNEAKDPDAESHELAQQISPDPIDKEKVEKAYEFMVAEIDSDKDDTDIAKQIKKGWDHLTADEQIAVNDKLKAVKHGKKQYNTILREYLNFEIKEEI